MGFDISWLSFTYSPGEGAVSLNDFPRFVPCRRTWSQSGSSATSKGCSSCSNDNLRSQEFLQAEKVRIC